MAKSYTDQVRDYAKHRSPFHISEAVTGLSISRGYAAKAVRELIANGELSATGNTSARTFSFITPRGGTPQPFFSRLFNWRVFLRGF